ncbi:glycosyltransferase family 2 protein [Aquimarina mytili]|uniref:Glycosyltransferase family 2 protein n=1 Tax=Aquimarina mytili TaxID=874423 RepID=A0A936ZVA2_9FLAO|nr:glycosyltransferase family 2 protein [Aquimarina mytili]MBL0682553.1 glycosyltransferase family 2 protein [Aquimarina mytili]
MELVSIVIGTYNGASYISEQLESILQQTYTPLEIIIVDDASTDETLDVIQKYDKMHSNIKMHAYDINVGYIKNFERGIALATGAYIALSDQDDWWMPTKIEKLMNHIHHYDLVYCDSIFVDENLQNLGSSFSTTKNLISINTPINLLIDNCVSGHAALFKKSLYEKAIPFPDFIPHDWWLAYVASIENNIYYLDEPLIKYRHHQNNVIASSEKNKKAKKEKKPKRLKYIQKRKRIDSFYEKCPDAFTKEKRIILSIKESYRNFSLFNNLKRIFVFYKNRKELLKIVKKNNINKIVYIANMFFKIK